MKYIRRVKGQSCRLETAVMKINRSGMWLTLVNSCAYVHLGVTGLKDLTINVPAMVRSGDTVTLTCSYDLEGSPLYSIQWSLEEVEFYRYMTERIPSKSAYNVSGIHVNVSIYSLFYDLI
ncbi:hypothetical protein M0804_015625 [Polistes exclamans]|nr:hypothetical protein M0804_015625 [Polistes exclamans]